MNTSAVRAASQPSLAVRSSKARKAGKTKKQPVVETLGPVEDLQSYVKADWWRDIFNANYLRTDGDMVDDPAITSSEVDEFLRILDSPSPLNASILDLCCGQGRHSLELARRGYVNVTGFDRSHYLITRARSTARKEELAVAFREGDARKLPFPDNSQDYVLILGNSFGYFEAATDDESVLLEVWRVLKPTGTLLLDLTDGETMRQQFEPRSWEWIDRNYFVCRERCLSDDQERLISREVITHTRKGVVSDQFYAERLYSQESLQRLLTGIPFADVHMHQPLQVVSQRNQDLGMMKLRHLYTARPDKDWAVPPLELSAPVQANVAVILGDPRRMDTVKPDGMFDEDDFHTINALKDALTSLENYEFSWYDNHDTLLSDARTIRASADFVLNLCDEGYDNRARWELHIPALLEMMGIPCTGGSPQCLAYCYDKSLVRGIARELDIPVPEAFVIQPHQGTFHEISVAFPVILKPNAGDSSVGITQRCVCRNVLELETAIQEIRERIGPEHPILVEQFLTGKDLTVGLIGNLPDAIQVLPIVEEDYSLLPDKYPRICGYEAKWEPDSPYACLRSIPADLPDQTHAFLVSSCQRLFERLECRDYARFDWRLDENGTPRLLEANPNPGWCWDGHLAKMAALAGMDYADMLRAILSSAQQRITLS